MANTGIAGGMPQNKATQKTPVANSSFPMSYPFYDTHRFAEITPFFTWDAVPKDHVQNRSSHKVSSYTLKAPLMQDVKMKKDYFLVNLQSILPRNWEKFYTQPNIGDDVTDLVGTSVNQFWTKVNLIMSQSWHQLGVIMNAGELTAENKTTALFRFLVLGEYFYSNGNLLAHLGCHGAPHCYFRIPQTTQIYSYDALFDMFMEQYVQDIQQDGYTYFTMYDGNEKTYYVTTVENPGTTANSEYSYISLREALDIFREDPTSRVISYDSNGSGFTVGEMIGQAITSNSITITLNEDENPLDISRLAAYQLVCAHYFSNDSVDYIYSADLYRQYMEELAGVDTFTVNGLTYYYDALSGYTVLKVLSNDMFNSATYINQWLTGSITDEQKKILSYVAGLFAIRRSLRFLDYFSGAKTRPLAIGDVNVNVSSNVVSAIDITKGIQAQRFLNAVNRTGRKISNYIKGLFGVDVNKDQHDPLWLANTEDIIFGEKSEYTGNVTNAEQNNITAVLSSNGARYQFVFDLDKPGVVIGLCHYDIQRIYTKTTEKSFYKEDRNDWFNPFLQYTGDQAVTQGELGLMQNPTATWGYQLNYAEFKQRYPQCAGGFVESLPGYIFPADLNIRTFSNHIDPDFIRSYNGEFDKFYVSLTGYSQGTYFHFIVVNQNDCTANRDMVFAPSIL